MIRDYSNYKISNTYYGGSEEKIGIFIGEDKYMIKFQKNSQFGFRYNHISEYIGSNVFNMLGIKAQETLLGKYRNKEVVLCKDFTNGENIFIPFNDIGESTIESDKSKYQYSYNDIIKLLDMNKKLTNVNETISSFFDMYIVDALLGNFDRHGSNWGFLKDKDKYSLAPIFDNGSCLFPSMIDENQMDIIMNSEEETNKRVYEFPTSQIKIGNKKSSYYDVISSLRFDECNKALVRIYKRIKLKKIYSLIDDIELISDKHKEFYKYIIKNRYEKILKYSYEKLLKMQ